MKTINLVWKVKKWDKEYEMCRIAKNANYVWNNRVTATYHCTKHLWEQENGEILNDKTFTGMLSIRPMHNRSPYTLAIIVIIRHKNEKPGWFLKISMLKIDKISQKSIHVAGIIIS